MKFKSPQVEDEFYKTSLFLQQMAHTMDEYSQSLCGQEIIITRIKEHVAGDSGVHEANRAFDARNQHADGYIYTDEQVKKIVEYMNEQYPRNDDKPTMIHHSFNGSPYHFHCQLAVNTSTYEPKTPSKPIV